VYLGDFLQSRDQDVSGPCTLTGFPKLAMPFGLRRYRTPIDSYRRSRGCCPYIPANWVMSLHRSASMKS